MTKQQQVLCAVSMVILLAALPYLVFIIDCFNNYLFVDTQYLKNFQILNPAHRCFQLFWLIRRLLRFEMGRAMLGIACHQTPWTPTHE